MIYLKTIFSSLHEIPFIKLNLKESFKYIDKLIVCEFNRTHTGEKRDFVFKNHFSEFSPEEHKKILYIDADVSKLTNLAINSKIAHDNEKLFRGYFAKQIPLKNNDIIFSVDADEIIFAKHYPKIIKKLSRPWNKAFALPMHQFYYKINFLWENFIFKSAVACKAKAYNKTYPAQWRDHNNLYPEVVGCHFSWCIPVKAMIKKIQNYSHFHDYKHLAQKKILEKAIKTKTYPFDPNRNFSLKELDIEKESEYFPTTLYTLLHNFKEVIG